MNRPRFSTVLATAVYLAIFVPASGAGQFRFGIKMTQHKAVMNVSRPPDALISARSLGVQAKPGTGFPAVEGLRANIEKALAGDFTISPGPDAVLSFQVTNYVPIQTATTVQTETRNVVVGKERKKVFGKEVDVDKYEMRQVPVMYWIASGSLTLQVYVHDKGGVVLDSFSPQSKFSDKRELSAGGVVKATPQSMPGNEALLDSMLTGVASDVRKRYTKTIDQLTAFLAVDEELRSGNSLAMNGDWQKALDAYNGAKLKKNAPDRLYNMAVCHEALAFAAYEASKNTDDAEPHFAEALKLYDEAMNADPEEKYFREAQKRLSVAKTNFARAKEQYAAQQREAEIAAAKEQQRLAAEEARKKKEAEEQAELSSKRADNQDEADFRLVARGRLKTQNGTPAPGFLDQLREFGKTTYKLDDLQARRVVHQETERLTRLKGNVEVYRQTLSELTGDKTIDAGERATLTRLAARLDLGPADTTDIEKQFDFKDLSAPPPPPAPKTPAVKPPKPGATKTPAAKPTVTPKPATPPAKPSIVQKPGSNTALGTGTNKK